MSDVIDQIRERYPIYKDVPDDELTRAIGEKYPVYLEQDENFRNDFERVMAPKSEESPTIQDRATASDFVNLGADVIEERRASAVPVESVTSLITGEPLKGAEAPVLESGLPATSLVTPIGARKDRGKIAYEAMRRAMTNPLVPVSKLTPTPEEIQAAVDVFASELPMGPETSEAILNRPNKPGFGAQVVSGALGAVNRATESMTSVQNMATLGIAGLPSTARRVVMGLFSAEMATQVPAMAENLQAAVKTGDPEAITGAAGDLAYVSMFAALSAKDTLRPTPSSPTERAAIGAEQNHAPETAAALRESLTPKEVSASEVTLPPKSETKSPIAKGGEPIENQIKTKKEGQEILAEPAGSEPETATPKGIASGVRTKWATATASDEGGFIINPLKTAKAAVRGVADFSKKVSETVKETAGEALEAEKMTDYRRSVLNWSAKQQQSFSEAMSAQNEIRKTIPNRVRREGITNWIQADGDTLVLQQRANATTNPKLKRGYEAALTLTPEEIAIANDVRTAYNTLGQRGQKYEVLGNFKDNYVTQLWNLKQGPHGGGSKTLKENFRFSKARTFDTFFDGEQAGYTPRTKDISELLPVYLNEMNNVIAARQLVEQLSKGKASDGRPLVAPRGIAVPADSSADSVTLVVPRVPKEGKGANPDRSDYKTMEGQPALSSWRWAAEDEAGKPIFIKSDLALHPEAHTRLKNVLGQSAIKEWYNTKTTSVAQIPRSIAKGLDRAQSETKRTMLGFFAPFHQVQEGTHAVGHRVNPFSHIPKIDLVKDVAQMDAAKHGLMLAPDRVSEGQFMEGFRTSGLVSKLPILGKASDFYSNYLFHQYIPGLKFKTYEAILERNAKVYEKDLASGKVQLEEVKALSAQQANAAYGHLNYADMARNPTIQHMMQLGLLAPDFLEARGRFFGQALKGASGTKVGREQLLALATLAIAQTIGAYTSAKLTGGEWDRKHPFEFHVGNRRYTMRSVPEDVFGLVADSRRFIYSRLNPLVGRGAVQYLSGVDWRGQKVSASETTKELVLTPIPLTLRGFLGTANSPLTEWEQLAGAVGLRISRYSPSTDVYELVRDFKKDNKDPKLVAEYERDQKTTHPDSDYKGLLDALRANELDKASEEYKKLLESKKPGDIQDHFRASRTRPFSGSRNTERKFKLSLTEKQQELYQEAMKERKVIYDRFREMRNQKP